MTKVGGFFSEMVSEQYIAAISEFPGDVELFTKDEFGPAWNWCHGCSSRACRRSTFARNVPYQPQRTAIRLVFCLEFDGLINATALSAEWHSEYWHTRGHPALDGAAYVLSTTNVT